MMIIDENLEAIRSIYLDILARTPPVGSRPKFSTDPQVYLETDTGKKINPSRSTSKYTIFSIGHDVKRTAILRSRTFRRYETVGAYTDDTRLLGVKIGEILLFGPNKTTSEDKHLRSKYLPGWHQIDSPASRWTNGAACLSLNESCNHFSRILAVEITETGQYAID